MKRVPLFLSLLTTAAILSGCGGSPDRWKSSRPAVVTARGAVTYNAQPLTGAIVVMQPSRPDGIAASALTDQEGKFELKSFPPEPGAVPGSYTVTIVKMDDAGSDPAATEDAKGRPIMQKSLIPARYSNPTQSGLKVEIPQAGISSIQLDLKG